MLIGDGIRKDEVVENFDLEMKEDKSTPPRSVEKSKTWPISARLLAGSLNPGEEPNPLFLVEVCDQEEWEIVVVGVVVGASPHTLIYGPDRGETKKLFGPQRCLDGRCRGWGWWGWSRSPCQSCETPRLRREW